MLKKTACLLFAVLSLSLVNCTPQPPDVFVFEPLDQHLQEDPITHHQMLIPSPACEEQIKEAACGHGVSIMSSHEIFVGEEKAHYFKGKPWSELRRESVYVPAVESYAPLETYIINSCMKMQCNDQVDRFRVKLDSLSGIQNLIKGAQ